MKGDRPQRYGEATSAVDSSSEINSAERLPEQSISRSRRTFIRSGALIAVGLGAGAVGATELWGTPPDRAVASTYMRPHGVTGFGQLSLTWEVNTDQPVVALTFDDGPRPEWTDLVLRILDRYQVSATFFMVGQRVREHSRVIQGRMGPHEIGNHTWSHVDLGGLGYIRAKDELLRAHGAIVDAVGISPRFFRPPYGHIGGAAALAASEMGYKVILWSRKMCEKRYGVEGQVSAMVREVAPGSIILAHDVGKRDRLTSINALPGIITGLRDRGFSFVLVSDLLRMAHVDA